MTSRFLVNPSGVSTSTDLALASKVKQCYNNITVNTNNITLENTDSGVSKTVAVSGGSSASTIAFNSISVSGNDLVFGKTDGNTDSEPLDGLTAITDLETLTTGHTTDIDDFKSREQFKAVAQHPDLTDAQLTSGTQQYNYVLWDVSVNGRTYQFANSSNEGTNYSYKAYQSNTDFWETQNAGNRKYETANGSYFDYSGSGSLDGHVGEWFKITYPESVILGSFTIQANALKSKPRSFKLFGSDSSISNFVLLGEYNDVVVSSTDPGTNFKLDSSLADYGTAYRNYFISITKIDAYSTERTVAIQNLRYFSVSKDVSDTIKKADESFNNATITGTNTLNLISDSGTTSLTLPTGTTATSVDALTFNFTVQTVGSNDKYFLNGVEAGNLPIELLAAHKYIFTFPAAHPLKLSRTADGGARDTSTGVSLGNEEFTGGVTYDSTTQLTFINGTIQVLDNLYYYCENHANMGGAIIEDCGFNNIVSLTYDDTSVPKLVLERAYHDIYGAAPDDITLSDSYTSAALSGSDLTLNRISGTNATTITLPSGTAASSTTNYPTSAMTSDTLPSPLVASSSTAYNLFTSKIFGTDNLGNIGGYDVNGTNFTIQQWAYDSTDNTVIITETGYYSGATTNFMKITLDGVAVANSGKQSTGGTPFTSASALISAYNSGSSPHHTMSYTFSPHPLFDLAVNESKAYHVFDNDNNSEWVSHSNTYDVSTGNYAGSENLGPLTTSGNADDGEYLKIDLGSTVQATTLTLKSVAEYKEPVINMNGYNQCGYEVSASSTSQSSPTSNVYELFNSLTSPSTDYWVSDIGKYDIITGNYSASANLGTDFPSGGTTADGEYVTITLPDKRKLVGYKLTKPDASTDDNSPKNFKLYARENSTSAWVLLTSESLTTAMGEYVSGDVNTGGTRFPSTGDLTPTTAYQTYALVVETIFTSGYSVWLSEFQLFCQPAEIENFKLYGSVNNSTWTEIHDQSTSANVTSSGVDFTITNPGSYQYYGLVVTKNTGYHNVSLGEMKFGVSQIVNLSEYYKLADWKTLIAGCADFAAFKTAVAAL